MSEEDGAKTEIRADEPAIQTSKYYDFKFSEDQLLEMKRCFDLYDSDFDGILDIGEVGNVVRSFRFYDPSNPQVEIMPVLLTEKDLLTLKKDMDPSQSGKVLFLSVLQ